MERYLQVFIQRYILQLHKEIFLVITEKYTQTAQAGSLLSSQDSPQQLCWQPRDQNAATLGAKVGYLKPAVLLTALYYGSIPSGSSDPNSTIWDICTPLQFQRNIKP